MVSTSNVRIHEVSFCGDVKSWIDALFAAHSEWPFSRATIEEFGTGTNKRQDLRVFLHDSNTPILCGEVKLPGTPEGRSPYDPALMQDAYSKADNVQCPYFFTWNVNTFVLFDRSKWNVPMIQRRVREWNLGLYLITPTDCTRPEVQSYIRDKFLPEFFEEFAAIVRGQVLDWGMAPDEIFIRSLESHLEWPVLGTRDYLALQCEKDKRFMTDLQTWMTEDMQWTFDPNNPDSWRNALDRVSRTLCYVFCNRAIFYEAIRAKYPESLQKLSMPKSHRGHEGVYAHFRSQFGQAILETGDYEPIFYPHVNDWAGALIFASDHACHGWAGVFTNLAEYNFREIPYDIVGGIFQKLIAPEERQKFGQYFTNEDIVDVINAFCIRRPNDTVLDPACGSGSFLVRAYHRKNWLADQPRGKLKITSPKSHNDLLREIFGCDIALFAAHLATLNLAARNIQDNDNYPFIRRGNFFEVAEEREAFCYVPGEIVQGSKTRTALKVPVPLPELDAVVGNPPYVRQELINKTSQIKRGKSEDHVSYDSRLKNTKEHMQNLCAKLWSGLKLTGRSDLHCYFWPVAAGMLKEGGYFGFLTSSSWLDVEYGFALQGWILKHFKIIAILESMDEPWFEDARVKTAATILQRCDDDRARSANLVRFVRLNKPVSEILGDRSTGGENARQTSAEKLRNFIERTRTPYSDDKMRIIPVAQSQLWEEGVKAGLLMKKTGPEPDEEEQEVDTNGKAMDEIANGYGAGKWGRFLRAPDLYFRLMGKYADHFVKLGEISEIRFGIKSGCDAFFMPRDVTSEVLRQTAKGLPWKDLGLMTPCKRSEAESGKVRIIRAGDNTLHPIEAEFLRPEVHSLMQVARPVVRADDLDRVVLWVDKPLKDISRTYTAKYIQWGAKQTFESQKSKAVPVPQRSTCSARPLWYDLTSATVGRAFWPMAQQYRHIIPTNPEGLVCNHNLFYLSNKDLKKNELAALTAILNSTLIGLFKTYYGRYAGTEGNLKTEVVDVNLLDIPDPRKVSKEILVRLQGALKSMQKREIGHLVEESLMDCHDPDHARDLTSRPIAFSRELLQEDRRQLDDAVLELLGIKDANERSILLDELYQETAAHFRQIRLVEIQKQEQRAGAGSRRLTAEDLAVSIWDSLEAKEKTPRLREWLVTLPGPRVLAMIPPGKAKAMGADHLYEPFDVTFTEGKQSEHLTYASTEQAELVALLANLEIRGDVSVPQTPEACKNWAKEIQARIKGARERFESLSGSRTGTHSLQDQTTAMLMQWFIHGRHENT